MDSNNIVLEHPKVICYTISSKENFFKMSKILKNLSALDEAFVKFRKPVEILQGSNTWEIGNKTKMIWTEFLNLTLETVKHSISKTDFRISWKVHSTPVNIPYVMSHILMRDTLRNKVIFKWKIEFETPEILPFTFDLYNSSIQESILLIRKIDKTIEEDQISFNSQSESVLVSTDINSLWNEITDLRKLCSYKENNVKIAKDFNQKFEIGAEVNFNVNEKICSTFKIKNIEIDLERKERKFVLDYVEAFPKLPEQLLEFYLNEFNENCTFLKFTHHFNEKLDKRLFIQISEIKKKLLIEIKKKFVKV